MVQLVKEKFDLTVTASLSSFHDTLPSLPEAYKEALYAQEFKLVAGLGEVIAYPDVSAPSGNYRYSMETEQLLSNSMKSGNFIKSKELLEEVLADNFSGVHPSAQKLSA